MDAIIGSERIAELVYVAIDIVNDEQPAGLQLPKALDTVLSGNGETLDSLGLVNLIVAVEEQIARELGTPITLFNMAASRRANSPFRTVASLVQYIQELVTAA